MDQTNSLNIFTDGGSRGNPGPSALGVYIENDKGIVLDEMGKYLGITTNNIAEYSAIVAALEWILQNKARMPQLSKISFYMDSQLASSQLNGLYRIKNPHLRELLFEARQKESQIGLPITYSHVPREQNKKADALVNIALDNAVNVA
jgi:ribonuclease HI